LLIVRFSMIWPGAVDWKFPVVVVNTVPIAGPVVDASGKPPPPPPPPLDALFDSILPQAPATTANPSYLAPVSVETIFSPAYKGVALGIAADDKNRLTEAYFRSTILGFARFGTVAMCDSHKPYVGHQT